MISNIINTCMYSELPPVYRRLKESSKTIAVKLHVDGIIIEVILHAVLNTINQSTKQLI